MQLQIPSNEGYIPIPRRFVCKLLKTKINSSIELEPRTSDSVGDTALMCCKRALFAKSPSNLVATLFFKCDRHIFDTDATLSNLEREYGQQF